VATVAEDEAETEAPVSALKITNLPTFVPVINVDDASVYGDDEKADICKPTSLGAEARVGRAETLVEALADDGCNDAERGVPGRFDDVTRYVEVA